MPHLKVVKSTNEEKAIVVDNVTKNGNIPAANKAGKGTKGAP
jgi:hypothetical protein